jgi:PAS domain S-box-containing protein
MRSLLDALVSGMAEGVLIADTNGRVVSSNRAAQALFGLSAQALSAASVTALIADAADGAVWDAAAGPRRTAAHGPGGVAIPVEATPSRIVQDNDQHVLWLLRDIRPVLAHEEALKAAAAAADEANRLKSHFLATMSHELRTPMNAILGFSEVIRDRHLGDDLARYEDCASSIHQSGQHLLSLINDILDLSKIEAGSYAVSRSRFCAAALAEECVTMLRAQADKCGVSVVLNCPPANVYVEADLRAIRQVTLNLLSNAVKFTPRGGYVFVTVEDGAAGATCTVRDTGIGISAAFLPRLFSPFSQEDSGLARKYEGTGLGLAITKKLIEAHGGAIVAASELGAGSTFQFTIPRAWETASPGPERAKATAA